MIVNFPNIYTLKIYDKSCMRQIKFLFLGH